MPDYLLYANKSKFPRYYCWVIYDSCIMKYKTVFQSVSCLCYHKQTNKQKAQIQQFLLTTQRSLLSLIIWDNLIDTQRYFILVLLCIFPITTGAEYLFICLVYHPLWWNAGSGLLPSLWLDFLFKLTQPSFLIFLQRARVTLMSHLTQFGLFCSLSFISILYVKL